MGARTMHGEEPRLLEVAERGAAGRVLARAFQDEPTHAMVVPDEQKRVRALTWLFDRMMRYALSYGQAYTTSRLEGVACWLPPGQTGMTLGRLLRSGLGATPLKLGWPAYRRFSAYLSLADALHHRHAPVAHWYLWVLGVEPPNQGQGIGSRLIQPVLARASAEGLPCYVETASELNVHFYGKHGFKVVESAEVPRYGLRVWAMLR